MNTLIRQSLKQTKYLFLRHSSALTQMALHQNEHVTNLSTANFYRAISFINDITLNSLLKVRKFETCRNFAKWKKPSKTKEEAEESDDETSEIEDSEEIIDDYNLVTKSVSSMRLDSVIKAAFLSTKKKVEKEFYAAKIRINGEKVLKKAAMVQVDDELDVVKGSHPENLKMILVDRVVIKSIGKVNANGNFPVKMQVLKDLAIENYQDPWVKSSLAED